MGLDRATWLRLALTLGVLLAVNLPCWQPGVGGARAGGGTELEMYYGWPATYRAELWHSADPTLASRILHVAPFYSPAPEMTLKDRYVGAKAGAVDLAFAGFTLAIVAIGTGATRPGRPLSRWAATALLVMIAGLVGAYLAADDASVHL